jgi:hypothetical protein
LAIAKSADESPLVYLVAPTLHFHPSFATLGRTIAPDIEIYRFDINEVWRAGVRVVRASGLTLDLSCLKIVYVVSRR